MHLFLHAPCLQTTIVGVCACLTVGLSSFLPIKHPQTDVIATAWPATFAPLRCLYRLVWTQHTRLTHLPVSTEHIGSSRPLASAAVLWNLPSIAQGVGLHPNGTSRHQNIRMQTPVLKPTITRHTQ